MPNFITRESYDLIMGKIKNIIEVEIPKVSKAKLLAAQEGDLSENAEYIGCKEKLELLSAQCENLKKRISDPSFIESLRIPGNIVSVGTKVEIEDIDSDKKTVYTILGSEDVDIEKNRISYVSPLAKGMIGKKAGDIVDIVVPDGKKKVKILKVCHFMK
ncbi:MAG: transcription elongation factor GreA [uncultured bacterium]|nr:MAG: transcription elongation factor GreA [uncultured bacterium]